MYIEIHYDPGADEAWQKADRLRTLLYQAVPETSTLSITLKADGTIRE